MGQPERWTWHPHRSAISWLLSTLSLVRKQDRTLRPRASAATKSVLLHSWSSSGARMSLVVPL